MDALLSTLPGDIEGLRRDGTVMRHAHYGRGVAFRDLRCQPIILTTDGRCLTLLTGWDVDLSDLTSRSHAAAYAIKATTYDTLTFMRHMEAGTHHSIDEQRVMDLASRYVDMTPEQIDTLARLVLRLAGRA